MEKSNMDVHFSSNSDEWCTPQWLYDELNEEFNFEWDIATSTVSFNSKTGKYACYTEERDAINQDWSQDFKVGYCNPPYSRGKQKQFVRKAVEQMRKGVTSVFLIPARTDTKAWHTYIWDKTKQCPREGVEVRFLEGRLKFEIDGKPMLDKNGKPQSAPFPSCIVVFRGME